MPFESDGTERTSFVKATPSAAQSVARIEELERRVRALELLVSGPPGADDEPDLFDDTR